MAVTHELLDLQTVDLATDRLRARRDALLAGSDVARAREAADAAERALGELGLEIDVLDRDGAKLEHEIDSLTQKAAAERTRMSDGSVANARELDAIGREVENLARRQTDREDELLVIMERREELERRRAEALAESTRLREEVDLASGDAATELRQVEAELDIRAGERAQLLPRIDPEVLGLYEELRAAKKGVGAAALVDGVCQGCHETLSAVELDRVKHADGVRRCEHCRRILVL
jgi:predicted  nucleic acid-binding Zn-ribbon protein